MENKKIIKTFQEFMDEKYPHHSSCYNVNYEAIFWDYDSTLPPDFTNYESLGVPSWIIDKVMFNLTIGGYSI